MKIIYNNKTVSCVNEHKRYPTPPQQHLKVIEIDASIFIIILYYVFFLLFLSSHSSSRLLLNCIVLRLSEKGERQQDVYCWIFCLFLCVFISSSFYKFQVVDRLLYILSKTSHYSFARKKERQVYDTKPYVPRQIASVYVTYS